MYWQTGSQQCTIDCEHLQTLPAIAFVSLAALVFARLTEQRFDRISPQPLTCFSYAASRRQLIGGQALSTDIQTPGHFMHRLIPEQGHAQHQPENLIAWQATPPYGGLRREVQRAGNPLQVCSA